MKRPGHRFVLIEIPFVSGYYTHLLDGKAPSRRRRVDIRSRRRKIALFVWLHAFGRHAMRCWLGLGVIVLSVAPLAAAPVVYKHAGLPPEKAAAAMTVPEGFVVTLFAGEPDVHQPIALCLDDRGRLWVAEAYSYPIRRSDKEAKDRILIFEDTDGDGKFDKRTVFMEG